MSKPTYSTKEEHAKFHCREPRCKEKRNFASLGRLCNHFKERHCDTIIDHARYKDIEVARCTNQGCFILCAGSSGVKNHLTHCRVKTSASTITGADTDDAHVDGPSAPSPLWSFAEGRAKPVTKVHDAAIGPFRDRIRDLIEQATKLMDSGRSTEADEAVAAFLHFPMIVRNSRGQLHSGEALKLLLENIGDQERSGIAKATLNQIQACQHAHAQPANSRTTDTLDPRRRILIHRHRIAKLVVGQQCSKALAALQQWAAGDNAVMSDDAVSSTEALSELAALHPAGGEGDRLPEARGDTKPYEVEFKQLELCIQGLPSLSAAAMSPWTFELIKQVALGEDSSVCGAILDLFNKILSGRGGDPTRWTVSRLVALRKPNGKIRPIAVGDVWFRLLGKCVAKGKAADAGKMLAPLNLGVGIPGGAEIIVHAANLYARLLRARQAGAISLDDDEDPYCLLATDFTNAFNTAQRREMADAILQRFPDLLPLFNWSYGHAADLRLGTGFRACSSATGVRQGDPLGPLFFCLGIQRTLEEMKTAHADVHFMFYLDDGTLFGRRSHLIKAFFDLKARCAKIGLILNTEKSVGWDPSIDEEVVSHGGLNWRRDGIKILGGPIGGALSGPAGRAESFAGEFAASQLEKYAEVIPHLRHLAPTIAFALLTTCVNARPTYLARTTEPDAFKPAATTFDDAVDVGLTHVAEWEGELPEVAKRVRGLPRTEGGCSLRRMFSCSEPAYAASFIHAADVISWEHKWLWNLVIDHNMLEVEDKLIKRLVPTFLSFSHSGVNFRPTEDPTALPQTLVSANQNYDTYVEQIAAEGNSALPPAPPSGRYLPALSPETARAIADQDDGRLPRGLRQKDLTAPLDKAEQQDIAALLRDSAPGRSAMFLSGKCDPSGVFMRLDALADRRFTRIEDPPFVTNLRIRLLLPLQNRQVRRTCPCGKKGLFLKPGWDDYHALECGSAGSATLINRRHNSVRDLLVKLLPNLLQGKGQVKVSKEKEYESVARAGKPIWEIDIELSFISVGFGPSTFLLDVAVTHPGGANHLRGGSNHRVGAAAHAIERRKDSQWGKILGSKRAGVSFVPFVVETGGFLGKKAVAFLDLICGVKQKGDAKTARGRTHLIRAVLTAVANSNHSLSGFHRSQVREFGVHYTPTPSPLRISEEHTETEEEAAAFYATDSDEEAEGGKFTAHQTPFDPPTPTILPPHPAMTRPRLSYSRCHLHPSSRTSTKPSLLGRWAPWDTEPFQTQRRRTRTPTTPTPSAVAPRPPDAPFPAAATLSHGSNAPNGIATTPRRPRRQDDPTARVTCPAPTIGSSVAQEPNARRSPRRKACGDYTPQSPWDLGTSSANTWAWPHRPTASHSPGTGLFWPCLSPPRD